jgi:hypothetical protein
MNMKAPAILYRFSLIFVIIQSFAIDSAVSSSSDNSVCDLQCIRNGCFYFQPADYVYERNFVEKDWVVEKIFELDDYCEDVSPLEVIKKPCILTKTDCRLSGFYASMFHNVKSDEYVLAFRGTDPGIDIDWMTNLRNFLIGAEICKKNTQYDRAERIALDMQLEYKRKNGKNIIVVGHSLGGGLASYAAMKHGLTAYVYNTARDGLLTKAILPELNEKRVKIYSYIVYSKTDYSRDLVSALGTPNNYTMDYYIPVELKSGAAGFQIVKGIKLHTRENIRKAFYENGCDCANIRSDFPKPLATAIVMDHSGSMADEQKIDYARQATLSFPLYMKQDDQLAVSLFSSGGSTPAGLELKSRDKIRPLLNSTLPAIFPNGNTNIGAGLQRGLEQLCTVSGEIVKKGALLLSDGMNNVGEYTTVVQQYRGYSIPIYTVKFGNQASEESLREIAAQTNGVFMDSNQQTIAGVYSGIYDAINGNSVVAAYHDYMRPDGELTYQIEVTPGADSLNINTSWEGSRLKTVFTSPSGAVFSGGQLPRPDDRFESGPVTQYTQMINPEPGRWRLDLSWDEAPEVAERVNLLVSEHTDVYTSILGFSPQYTANDKVTINVHATELDEGNNKIPLKDATVQARVRIPGPEIIQMILAQSSNLRVYRDVLQDVTREIELFDDGKHNDYNRGDGIFGAYFTETQLNGPYIVTAHIKGTATGGRSVDRYSTGSFHVGSLQDAEVTTSRIVQYTRKIEEQLMPGVVNPLGNMQSVGAPGKINHQPGTDRKKRSRSLMDKLSN